ncbi:MAG: hypothetical protein WAV56_04925 [Microgenomates group bacterium]
MFEIRKQPVVSSEKPIRHFQRGLEYESNQVHLWLLSHKDTTAGFLVYLLQDKKMIVHLRPPLVDLGPEVRNLASTEKVRNEAVFIVHRFRKMGGMKLLLSELFEEALRTNIKEIQVTDITENWLVKKMTDLLLASGYDQIHQVYPQEGEGSISLIARRGGDNQVLPNLKSSN